MYANSRVCAYISKDAIIHNVKEIRNATDKSVKLMAVIKADGYGHGAVSMANALEDYADYFAVAIVEEAVELRNAGIIKPVLVLGYTSPELYRDALNSNITLTAFTYEDAKAISDAAERFDKIAKIHIAVDTGMGRIGFPPEEKSADIIKKITKLKNIFIEGVFTHFSTADEADLSFTKKQTERYSEFRKMLEVRGIDISIYHAANSGAIIQHKETAFDMVRAGIILYGLYPSGEVDKSAVKLMPVMELHSRVIYVKSIKKGDSVSYGRTFIANKEMRIATIPVGYADGYPRLLSGKGRVIINGKYAPIVGRICMDQFMVDITDIDGVEPGSKVVLMGTQGESSISADEIAHLTGTINYEVVCAISKRVPREVIK